jgi:hypothetical protein
MPQAVDSLPHFSAVFFPREMPTRLLVRPLDRAHTIDLMLSVEQSVKRSLPLLSQRHHIVTFQTRPRIGGYNHDWFP